jgi:hypothetical protein
MKNAVKRQLEKALRAVAPYIPGVDAAFAMPMRVKNALNALLDKKFGQIQCRAVSSDFKKNEP